MSAAAARRALSARRLRRCPALYRGGSRHGIRTRAPPVKRSAGKHPVRRSQLALIHSASRPVRLTLALDRANIKKFATNLENLIGFRFSVPNICSRIGV
jgi:hypothetical protein